jgi:hypothetical protein
MVVIVEIDIDSAEVDAYFTYAGYKARDMRDPFEQTGDMTLALVEEQFLSEGVAMSGGWVPLSAQYSAEKEKQYPGQSILVRTGDMKQEALNPRAVHVTKHSMRYAPNHATEDGYDLIQIHMDGRDSSKPMPARPSFEETSEWYDTVEDIFMEWLDDLASANTRRRVDSASRPPAIGPSFVYPPGGFA